MKVLSIDVGIKNLAFCLFYKPNDSLHFNITKWDVVNVSQQEDTSKCGFLEKNKVCNKPSKFKKNNNCFCLKHSKKQLFTIPTPEVKPSFINKQKINTLFAIADKYSIAYEKPIIKKVLVDLINTHVATIFFEPVIVTNASKVDLISIGKNIKDKFNALFSNEGIIDYVIIENQISPIANRMKTIQGMIVQYFIMSEVIVDNIEFISASNKLKECNVTDKTNYNDRKKTGILKCLDIISSDDRFKDKLEFFNAHKKKDDLSDSFLQGIWFINNKKI